MFGRVERRRRTRGAFTLIELLLVLVILTVLAAVVVPRFAGRSKQARIAAAGTDISNLGVQLNAFEVDAGRYPTTEEGLGALLTQPSDVKVWHGPYIEKGIPKDPWGNPYVYKCPGDNNTAGYDLSSNGPDGQAGNEDDIDNWRQP